MHVTNLSLAIRTIFVIVVIRMFLLSFLIFHDPEFFLFLLSFVDNDYADNV